MYTSEKLLLRIKELDFVLASRSSGSNNLALIFRVILPNAAAPIIVQVLEGENAILKNREIMGATNPDDAKEGTIRKQFALSIEANSVHGSDSSETAIEEINYFFEKSEII